VANRDRKKTKKTFCQGKTTLGDGTQTGTYFAMSSHVSMLVWCMTVAVAGLICDWGIE
jgi:hypothetical protein